MGVTARLTPDLVRHCLVDEEIPLRSQSLPPDIVQRICRYGAPIGSVIQCFDRRQRCMDHARELIRRYEDEGKSFPSGMTFVARELTAGKGRFQRAWHAPAGGLWMTLVLVNTLLPDHARLVPLAAGVACCEAIRAYGTKAHIKWVNDLHVDGRKLAGILVETMTGPGHGEEYILIGVGINVNNDSFPEELVSRAVSMKDLLQADVDIDLFAGRLLAKFVWNIGLLHYEEAERLQGDKEGSSHPLLERWRSLSDTIGRRVLFGFDVQRQPQFEALVKGLEKNGGLVLEELGSGRTVTEQAGEIVYLD